MSLNFRLRRLLCVYINFCLWTREPTIYIILYRNINGELEIELIQTQMTQKPMLRAEVYARALRASQNRKEDNLQRARSIILPPPSKVETVHEIFFETGLKSLLRLSVDICAQTDNTHRYKSLPVCSPRLASGLDLV